MGESKPAIPFGFQVYVGGEPRDLQGRRLDALGGFMFDRLQSQPHGIHEKRSDVECPLCHEPLVGLSHHPNGAGRCVFDDGQTVLVDPLPQDVEPLSCVPCNLTFYVRADADA